MASLFGGKKGIILEGNIGAGKSTFLNIIKRHLDVEIVPEPLDRWQSTGGDDNLLDRFYGDIKRWAYTFQNFAFITRVRAQEEAYKSSSNDFLLFERSVYCDRYCFAKNCFEMGTMTALEWRIYKEWFEWLVTSYTKKPDGFIYLHTKPEICFERLRGRDRSEEAAVPFDYIQRLHNKHNDWLLNGVDVADYLSDIPVLVLDCDKDFEHDVAEQKRHADRIAEFFGMTYLSSNVETRKDPSISL